MADQGNNHQDDLLRRDRAAAGARALAAGPAYADTPPQGQDEYR